MKRTFTLLAAAFATTAAAQKPYHRDLAVLEVNREAPRTEFVEFASRDEALTRSFERSDAYRSLDGVWKFRYADDVRALPADATAADADTSAWSDIRVPGNWELQGHGTPIYVNTRYEYATIDPAPPHLPEAIPAGVYRRTFTVPEAWAGRRVYLTIGGAKSGVYVYVNGREAGYNDHGRGCDLAYFFPDIHSPHMEPRPVTVPYRFVSSGFFHNFFSMATPFCPFKMISIMLEYSKSEIFRRLLIWERL